MKHCIFERAPVISKHFTSRLLHGVDCTYFACVCAVCMYSSLVCSFYKCFQAISSWNLSADYKGLSLFLSAGCCAWPIDASTEKDCCRIIETGHIQEKPGHWACFIRWDFFVWPSWFPPQQILPLILCFIFSLLGVSPVCVPVTWHPYSISGRAFFVVLLQKTLRLPPPTAVSDHVSQSRATKLPSALETWTS